MSYSVIDALANPIRIQLILCLSNKEKTVQELINKCQLSQSSVSQHLMKLKDAKLVKDRKEGRFVYYSIIHTSSIKLAKDMQELEKQAQHAHQGES
ncbi:MAG: winged helix-turn-helix transcriptional regulator [Candidatus Levybacteria bacterium]|nr:winged helix-turn-helix transcriptional regulator [Candidatus Levybacteria bacterium]